MGSSLPRLIDPELDARRPGPASSGLPLTGRVRRLHHDLLTLRLFVAVYEERSIAKAAEREHIAASAGSKRLSDLEATLKLELFRR
jgi:hypothetical protein